MKLTFHFSRSCLTTSFHMLLGCRLAKLLSTSNFQYTLSQELSSISILSIFKISKKQAQWNREKENVSSLFTDSENDKIIEVDENNLFHICVTYGNLIGSESIAQTKEMFYLQSFVKSLIIFLILTAKFMSCL